VQKRQEKNEFNFHLQQKKFLDWKNEARVSVKNRNAASRNFAQAKPLRFGINATNSFTGN
jgi:hypothetical protein